MANRIEFGGKESYMLPLNAVITEFTPQMDAFLDSLATFDGNEPNQFVSISERLYHEKVKGFCELLKKMEPELGKVSEVNAGGGGGVDVLSFMS
jgi:hypothetical protein